MLSSTALVLVVFTLLGLVAYDPAESRTAFLVVYGAIAAVTLPVIWYFWRGQNWARWLVLATSVLALVTLTLPPRTRAETVVMVIEAAYGAWLLYWLNTKPVARFFRQTPRRPTLTRVAAVTIVIAAGAPLLVIAALLVSMPFTPTLRPVYGEGISSEHREALRGLHPDGERLLGLFSRGVTDVAEEGCFFTDRRLVIFENGRVVRQATFPEIRHLSLQRERGFFGLSELTIERADGIALHCQLPNATAYPNDAGEFHERLTRAWRP